MPSPKTLLRLLLLIAGVYCLAQSLPSPAPKYKKSPDATIAVPALSRVAVRALGLFHKP